MKSYEKPIAVVNDELSEGVYAASGTNNADCWTINSYSVQDWNGSHHVFEVKIVHSDAVKHISTASTSVITFSNTVTDAYSEGNCTATFSGNTVTVVRTLHANAYQSGDVATYKVWVKSTDEASTKAITCTGSSISCTKSVNVQGEGGDGS